MANIVRREPEPQGLGMPGSSFGLDPFRLMRQMLSFDPWRQLEALERAPTSWMPQFEVKETGGAYVIKADVPGVNESDLDLSVAGNRLVIAGQRVAEDRQEGESFYAYERSYGSFTRAFTLPEDVDAENVQAELKQGVLVITIPKRAEHRPRKISLKGVVDKVKDALSPGEKTDKGKPGARAQDDGPPPPRA